MDNEVKEDLNKWINEDDATAFLKLLFGKLLDTERKEIQEDEI